MARPPILTSNTGLNLPHRAYITDVVVLGYVFREGYGYSSDISRTLNRSRRSVNRHLSKLERLGLIKRIGSVRCPHQWYMVPYHLRPQVARIVKTVLRMSARYPRRVYFTLKGPLKLLFQVPTKVRHLSDPGRPGGRSIPFRSRSRRPRLLQVFRRLRYDPDLVDLVGTWASVTFY